MALIDSIRSALSGAFKSIRKRIGVLRVYRIYQYEVRCSGYVLPPKEVRKNKDYSKTTVISFELSFETFPFFRTFTPAFSDARKRFESELIDLVRNQEKRTIEYDVFSYPTRVPLGSGDMAKFLGLKPKQRDEFMENFTMSKPVFPEFVVTAIDFEPVEFFDVDEGRLKEFRSIDSFIFKVYRPMEETEYESWNGEFIHEL
jgi:hypothetical protein